MYARRKFAALGAAALLTLGVTGCASTAKKAAKKALKDQGIEVNEKDSSVTFKDDSGHAFAIGGKELPDGWPKELALPEGSAIITSVKSKDSSGEVFAVQVGSNKTPKQLLEYFEKELQDAGYKKGDSFDALTSSDDSEAIRNVSYRKGDRAVTVTVLGSPDSDYTSVASISITPAGPSGSLSS